MSNLHTHAHQPAHHAPAGRKAIKQLNERLRRDRRELAEALRERLRRECYPAREEGRCRGSIELGKCRPHV